LKTVTEEDLGLIATAIIKAVNPKLIVLFGSQSRGNANKNSDIDLLVIGERPDSDSWSRRRAIGNIRRSLPGDIPVDVLFYTPEEVNRWKDTTNHIIREALAEGSILYERP